MSGPTDNNAYKAKDFNVAKNPYQSMQLCFLVNSYGEAKPEVFRPNLESMWWGRRDALARCTAAALWTYRGPSVPSPTLSLYLAGDGSVLRHVGALTASVTVPTERRLVAAWRAASGGGGAVPLGLACVRQQRKEAEVSNNGSSDSTNSNPHVSSGASSVRHNGKAFGGTSTAPADLASFGKRQLLTHLQATLPLEALRRHNLNSSPAVLMKKSTVPKLLAVHAAWLAECGPPHHANTTAESVAKLEHVSKSTTHSAKSSVPSSSSIIAGGETPAYGLAGGALANVFRGLPPAETILLLLHEDFPNELYNPSAVTTALSTSDGIPKVPPLVKLEGSSVKHVVCVLGAVRDMSSEEDADVVRCAQAHGVRIARANLGRTAEFTSKVILGINNLNAHGQLASIAAAFAAENHKRQQSSDCEHVEFGSHRQPSLHDNKLAPVRGWTWNGHRTTTSIVRPNVEIATKAPVSTNEAVASFDKTSCAANASDLESSKPSARFQLHAVVALPFESTVLQRAALAATPGSSYDTNVRDAVHAAVQAAVWVLWRSKVAGEAAKGDGVLGAYGNGSGREISETSSEERGDRFSKTSSSSDDLVGNDDDDQGLVPVLTLAFSDGPMLTVKRRGLVRQLADAHHAAPSEFQVLQALAAAPLDRRAHAPPLQRVLETYSGGTSTKMVPKCLLLNVALDAKGSGESMSKAIDAETGHSEVAVPNNVVVALGFSHTEVHGATTAFSHFDASTSVRIAPPGVAVNSAGAAFAALQQWHLRGLLLPAVHALFPKALRIISKRSKKCSTSNESNCDKSNDTSGDQRKRRTEKKKKSKRERPDDDSSAIKHRESHGVSSEAAEEKTAKKRRREKS